MAFCRRNLPSMFLECGTIIDFEKLDMIPPYVQNEIDTILNFTNAKFWFLK